MKDFTEDQGEERPEDRRRHFRLEYPPDQKPVLRVRKYKFKVINISQGGLSFINDQDARFGKWLNGEIIFPSGDVVERDARVIWNHRNVCGIEFLIRIPFKVMLEQQKILINLMRESLE